MREIETVKSEFQTWLTNKMSEAQKAIDEVSKIQRGSQGFQGMKGEKGEAIVGPRGEAGPQGPKGDVGDTPVAGLDFPMPKDGIDGKDGKDANPLVVVEYIKKLPAGKRLQIEHIDGLKQTIDAYGRQITEPKWRGGGDTVVAGTGITITRSFATGKSTISFSGGTVIENELVAGSGTTFTLANTPIAGSVKLYAARNRIYPTTDWTIVGTVITTVLTWSAGDLIADYRT